MRCWTASRQAVDAGATGRVARSTPVGRVHPLPENFFENGTRSFFSRVRRDAFASPCVSIPILRASYGRVRSVVRTCPHARGDVSARSWRRVRTTVTTRPYERIYPGWKTRCKKSSSFLLCPSRESPIFAVELVPAAQAHGQRIKRESGESPEQSRCCEAPFQTS